MNKLKSLLSRIKILLPVGAAIGMVRVGSNVFGSMNPMLTLIFYSGQKQGKINGLIVGVIATIVSSIYCGIGPWCLIQLPMWALAGFLGGCIKSKETSVQTICIFGFMFGVVMDFFSYYLFGMLGYRNVLAQIAGGLAFDIRYCVVSTVSLVGIYAVEYALKKSWTFAYSKLKPVFSR